MRQASTTDHPKDTPQIGLSTSLSYEQLQGASSLLKALANENRLTILYLLRSQERSVLELARLLGLRQPTVSQHLARLREENVVKTRRNGQVIYYSLESESALQLIDLLEQLAA
jgi:DNA-binding transcriptional ArsR family regulator